MIKLKEHKTCTCDQCLYFWYCSPCSGCKDGHPSFWKTVIESPQWKEWSKEQQEHSTRDMPEVEEMGDYKPRTFSGVLEVLQE